MSDVLRGGWRFRILNPVDVLGREGFGSAVDTSLPAARVVRSFDAWAYEHGIPIRFIQPGKPIQNGLCESFNGRMRDECLNLRWWRMIEEARRAIQRRVVDYSTVRPHSALGREAPAEFARDYAATIDPRKLHTGADPAME